MITLETTLITLSAREVELKKILKPGWLVLGMIVVGGILSIQTIILPIIFLVAFIKYYNLMLPEMRELSDVRREKKQIAQLINIQKQQQRQQQIEQERQQIQEAKINKYKQLRKDIEAMPQYSHWRQDVLRRFGDKCAVCGSTDNIEVDHRYKSFYAIVKECSITNTIQAYECAPLWDINNGAPLCKMHHDQTRSSIYYREHNHDNIFQTA